MFFDITLRFYDQLLINGALPMINNNRLIATFLDLVKIPSPSWNEEPVIQYIERCASELGYESLRSPCRTSYNLIVRIPGNSARKPILFAAHTDTVTPCDNVKPIETQTKITSDGTSILGGDDKAAVAVFIEAMRIIKETNLEHPPLEFVFTCSEEVGLMGMKGMDFSLIEAKRAFVFDCSGSVGGIIMQAPSQIVMHADVTGKAAHAGIEPEKGISAINIVAEIITKLPKGRIDKETTLNIGMISGGRATNIVAEKAAVDLEMRSLNHKKMKALEKKTINTIKAVTKKYGAKVAIRSHLEYTGFTISEKDPLSKLMIASCRDVKIQPAFMSSGGGSDTNILNAKGIKALNLAIGMSNVHSTREFILKKDIINGCRLLLSIVKNG
jgi:tripeptide aminopeptidase